MPLDAAAIGRGFNSTGWAWDADFFDCDNDGDDDLYVVNGMNEYAVYSSVNPYLTDASGKQQNAFLPVAEKEVPVFFVNRDGKLVEETAQSGADPAGNARSVAWMLLISNDAAIPFPETSATQNNPRAAPPGTSTTSAS